jgi:hypothetical protein
MEPLPSINWSEIYVQWSLRNVERELTGLEDAVCIFINFYCYLNIVFITYSIILL